MSGFFLVVLFIIKIHVLNANSEDLDQTPRSAASDLGLHCLPMSILWDARHIWIKVKKNRGFSVLFLKQFKFLV